MTNSIAYPEVNRGGEAQIAAELDRVRLQRAFLGELPAFRRGLMYYDFQANIVRVAPVQGGAA